MKEKLTKSDVLKYGLIGLIMIICCILIVVLVLNKESKVTCTLNKDLIEGFKNEETLIVKVKKDEVTGLSVEKKVSIDDYYKERGSFNGTLKKVFENAYSYLPGDDYKITVHDADVIANVDIKESGIVLNNLVIKSNGEDKTSLRFDTLNDIDNEANAIKVKDKITKADLKKKIEAAGYTCK